MPPNSSSPKISDSNIDLTNPTFGAYFLKFFGNSGFLPYPIKISLLTLSIFLIEVAIASWFNVLHLYMTDNIRHAILILLPITFSLFIYVCKQVDVTLKELDKIFWKPKNEFIGFIGEWRKQSKSFYVLCVTVGVILFSIMAIFSVSPYAWNNFNANPPLWIKELVENGTINPVIYVWTFVPHIIIGYIIGLSFNRLLYCVRIINDYGNRFITCEKINLRHAVVTEELNSLSKLAIKIDFILIAPTFLFATILFNNLIFFGNINYTALVFLVSSLILFIFFATFPLINLHSALKKAKKQLLGEIDGELAQLIEKSNKRVGEFSNFNDILQVRDRVGSMNTWAMNNPTILKFALTFFLPIIFGALFQIFFEAIL